MLRIRTAYIATAAIVVVLATVFIIRWRHLHSQSIDDVERMAMALHSRAQGYDRIQTADRDAVRSLLVRAVPQDVHNRHGVAIDGAIEVVADFLALRARQDVEGYIEWMQRRRFTLPEALRDDVIVNIWWTLCTGSKDKPTGDILDVYRVILECNLNLNNGSSITKEIASTPGSVFIGAASLTPDNRRLPTPNTDFLGSLWSGGIGTMGHRYWRPPRSLDEIIDQDRSTLGIRVSLVGYGATPSAYILSIGLVYDRRFDLWHIHSVSFNNNVDKPLYTPQF